MNGERRNPETVLSSVNRRLAELLREEPLTLTTGGSRTLEDPLWVWGIVGGKDVGKTTLINALAGGDVVEPGVEIGEGTFRPSVYLTEADLTALQARFADLAGLSIIYHPDAPPSMHGLALVDLPDFDSLFADHAEQVRRIAGVLDGIIWVTTPKKVGDLRAIREIQRVLKSRTNFAYVVNKMDWVLAQSDRPPREELERATAALRAQVAECDPGGGEPRSFLISGKYRTPKDILNAIARGRDMPDATSLIEGNGELREAVRTVANNFESLRRRLTTAPTAEAAAANKRANLGYQIRAQAGQLLDHYRPTAILDRLDRAAGAEELEELATRFFPPVYHNGLIQRLNADRRLFAEWSTTLFKNRIAYWSLLGIVAWPIALVGAVLGGVRMLRPAGANAGAEDAFRFDGIALEDRVEGVLAGVRARLAGLLEKLTIQLPDESELTARFRADASLLADEHRRAVIEPLMERRPGAFGRFLRWLIPVLILLWFPFVQPVLAGLMTALVGGMSKGEAASLVIHTLSATKILSALVVVLLIYAAMVGIVYSRAVRDTFAALERLRNASAETIAEPMTAALLAAVRKPVDRVRAELADLTATLRQFAGDAVDDPNDGTAERRVSGDES